MFWKITADHLGDEPSAVGKGNGEPTEGEPTYTFKLYDDDNELYYSGVFDKEAWDADDDESGAGLYTAYKWGMWNAGSTDLRVKLSDIEKLTEADSPVYRSLARSDGWCSIFG